MSTPSWLLEVEAQAARERQLLQQSAPVYQGQFGDSFHTAPGYRELDVLYSITPGAMYSRDTVVEKRIRSEYPDLVPLWVTYVFLSPADTGNPQVETFGRHGLGRVVEGARTDLPYLKVDMGDSHYPRPHIIEHIFEGERHQKYGDLPGAYVPFDGRVYQFVRDNYGAKSAKELKAFRRQWKQKMAEAQVKVEAEAAYAASDIDRFVARKLAEASEVDLKNAFMGRYFGKREYHAKPFVHIRRDQ